MKVAYEDDHTTSITLGGLEEEISFGVSNSAEFIQVLSSTLYSNQILAVVRETICNAWDAHIEAGIEDRPIEITLTTDKLTIRDFGQGIPHEDIGPIYAVYGSSTKKNCKNSTGGFGLGCKAPFAYTDSFGVVSMNRGKKHTYRMNKSSIETGGLPSISTILSTDTDDSGLIVTMDLSPRDHKNFAHEIKVVLSTGAILAKLNGELFEGIIDYPKNSNFLLYASDHMQGHLGRVHVKYGNVLYPVDPHQSYLDSYEALIGYVEKVDSFGERVKPILLAKPDSLSITPSRETLSMTDHTIKELKRLLDDACNTIKNWLGDSEEWYTRYAQGMFAENKLMRVFSPIRYLVPRDPTRKKEISSKEEFLELYYSRNTYTNSKATTLLYRTYINTYQSDNKLLHRLARHLGRLGIYGDYGQLVHNEVFKPLYRGLYKHPSLRSRHLTSGARLQQLSDPSRISIWQLLGLSQKIVVLSQNFSDDNLSRIQGFPEHKAVLDKGLPFVGLYYKCSRKGENEAATQFFKARGFTVLDLTKAHPWEEALLASIQAKKEKAKLRKKNRAAAPRKPKILSTGLPKVSVILQGTSVLRHTEIEATEDDYIEHPEFLMKAPAMEYVRTKFWGNFPESLLVRFIQMFGERGAIYKTQKQYDRFKEKGAVPVELFLKKIVDQEMGTTEFKNYCQNNISSYRGLPSANWVELIQSDPVLAKHFGIKQVELKDSFLFPEILHTASCWGFFSDMHTKAQTLAKNPKITQLAGMVSNASSRGAIHAWYTHEAFTRQLGDSSCEGVKKHTREIIKLLFTNE